MRYALIVDNQITQHGPSHELWPDIGFPPGGPTNEFLAQGNAARIIDAPAFDSATHKAVTVEPYLLNGSVFGKEIVALTQEELDQIADAKRQDMVASALQLRRAIRQLGLRATVNAWIAMQSEDVQEDWEYASEIRRLDPVIEEARDAFGWTNAQMDEVFALARTL